jgi:ribose 5-phosphate isomerase B
LGNNGHIEVDYVEGEDGNIDYPDVAATVAWAVSTGKADFGVLICGTGIGMSVVANKFPGVRAAPCHSELTAEFSRRFNDANILCLSGDMLNEISSLQILKKWLQTPFDGGTHEMRLEKIREIERLQ